MNQLKKWAIPAGAVLLVVLAVVVYFKMKGETKPVEELKVEAPKGPDPAHLAKVEELARQVGELEAKGEFKDALWTLRQLAKLEPGDPRVTSLKPGLEEKLRRLEAWQSAHQRAEVEKKDATRTNTTAAWQKVLDLCAEAEKNAPTEKQQRLTRDLQVSARQYRDWSSAREEERKGNFAAAIDLVTAAIAAAEPPADLAAYKVALERRKRKQEFDRAASAARSEPVPAKAYDLWQKSRVLAEDPKDVADVDAKLHALKPWVDPAERDRRYDEALKAGDAALAGGDLDAAEKAFKDALALKVTELKPGQCLTRVATLRRQKSFEAAVAEARAAEEKKAWADAIDAYDAALKVKPGDSTITARRKELEDSYRPPKIVIQLSEGSGIKMEFVLIKRGSFLMGDAQGNSDEKPHQVTIAKDFWMQTTELTQAHWSTVMPTKPWMSQGSPHLPVEGVSWEDTQKYFEKLNPIIREQIKGRTASLPTEAEWEYACRAGTKTRWNFGNDEAQMEIHGWGAASKVRGPQTVGQKPANAWGLFDMHGNVAEWCADAYVAPDEKADAEASPFRCIRGGSWNDREINCRSSKRERDVPTKSNLFLGFRAVLR
jgi:formylglycine-generating enzyme required for sulfatase activity